MKKPSNTIKKTRCPRCGYVWENRVDKPKACPECKLRLGWYTKRNSKK